MTNVFARLTSASKISGDNELHQRRFDRRNLTPNATFQAEQYVTRPTEFFSVGLVVLIFK
jgi:hypothetical protein